MDPETNTNSENQENHVPLVPKPKGRADIIMLIGLFLMASSLGGYFLLNDDKPDSDELVFCTADAKMCSDGSYVGRVAPDCEFAVCLGESEMSNWQTYRNEEFGFEFEYPLGSNITVTNYKIIEEGPGAFWEKLAKHLWEERLAKQDSYRLGDNCIGDYNGETSYSSCVVYSVNPYVFVLTENYAGGAEGTIFQYLTDRFDLRLSHAFVLGDEAISRISSTFKFLD